MGKENRRPRPKAMVRPSRQNWRRDVRHHSPRNRRRSQTPHARRRHSRTRWRSPTPRVRVLSSITVVPPRPETVVYPIPPRQSPPVPSFTPPLVDLCESTCPLRYEAPPRRTNISPDREEHSTRSPASPWRTPASLGVTPTHSPWREQRSLVPPPMVTYGDQFEIMPGKAYESVPLYVNRDIPWQLKPIDVPPQRRIRFYREDVQDPRMHDFRVEVTPLPVPTIRESTSRVDEFDQRSFEALFESPTPPVNGTHLFQPPARESDPEPPRPAHILTEDRISDELRALLRLARLFEGPRESTEAAYQRFKRSRCTRRRRR